MRVDYITQQLYLYTTLYLESFQQQKNSRFSLVAEIANISLANQVTQKSTSEFKTSEKIGSCRISNYSLSFFGNGMNGNARAVIQTQAIGFRNV